MYGLNAHRKINNADLNLAMSYAVDRVRCSDADFDRQCELPHGLGELVRSCGVCRDNQGFANVFRGRDFIHAELLSLGSSHIRSDPTAPLSLVARSGLVDFERRHWSCRSQHTEWAILEGE